MNKTKQRILKESRALFNELGYTQVTIRMIALRLKMSSGNLNYHYKKREDILEALYFEMVTHFDNRINELPKTEVSISQIKNDIQESMQRMIAYQFFWTDLYTLLNSNAKIKTHFQKVYSERINGCYLLFEKLENQNLIKKPKFLSEYKFLAERMISFGNTWLYSTKLYIDTINQKDIQHQVSILLTMLYPYLTHEGKKAYEVLESDFFQ
jgi:AcrR family transcriptional regulator